MGCEGSKQGKAGGQEDSKSRGIVISDLPPFQSAVNVVPLSAEAKQLLADHGWNKGVVGFGNLASEAVVKVTSALALVGMHHRWIELTFDGKELSEGEKNTLGVKSRDWNLLSGDHSRMPTICIDGVMFVESVHIVKLLAKQSRAPREIMDVIAFVSANDTKCLEAAKHWGWAALHASNNYAMVNKKHYAMYGMGKKDEAWEMEAANTVKFCLDKLEAKLEKKSEINGFFFGDTLTLADCVLCSWPLTLGPIAGVNMEKRYPKVQANYEKLKKIAPEGMKIFFEQFPRFCDSVLAANKENRDNGFDINKYLDPPAVVEQELAAIPQSSGRGASSMPVSHPSFQLDGSIESSTEWAAISAPPVAFAKYAKYPEAVESAAGPAPSIVNSLRPATVESDGTEFAVTLHGGEVGAEGTSNHTCLTMCF